MASLDGSGLTAICCPLCGGAQYQFERSLKGFTLVQCKRCGLVFVNPQLSAEALLAIYQDQDSKDVERLRGIYADLATPSVLAEYDRKLEQLEAMLGRKGKILDFACAAAYFLERAAAKGWDAHGVDIGGWAREVAKARGVNNVHIGHLSDLDFPHGHFDVIYAAQALEHLQSPLATLEEIRRILRPGGILYVDVPNYRTIPIVLDKDDFYLNNPPQHVNYFTPRTLGLLLERANFDIEYLTTEGGLKWENLIGRPITSEIADAYRIRENGFQSQRSRSNGQMVARLKGMFRPIVKRVLYEWAKVGINLVAISRRPQE